MSDSAASSADDAFRQDDGVDRSRRPFVLLGVEPDVTLGIAIACALVVHIVGFMTLSRVRFGRGGMGRDIVMKVDVEKLVPERFAERQPELVETRPLDTTVAATQPIGPAAIAPAAIADVAEGPVSAGLGDPESVPEKEVLDAEEGDKFVGFIQDLRLRGMDVVFVFDSTTSMKDVIEKVKRNVERMVAVLHALVPECRLGVVTYRDKGSEYVTKRRDLTGDRDAVLSFVGGIEVGIGRNAWNVEDWPEAVCQGLTDALHNDWRRRARKAVIVIGDAPPPDDEQERALDLAARFRRQHRGTVHTIYVPTVSADNMKMEPGSRANRKRAAGRALLYSRQIQGFFQRLARAGGGEALQLTAGKEVARHLLTLAFGLEWQGNIEKIYSRAGVR